MASCLIKDLNIDSLDWIEIWYEIEEEFKLEELDDPFIENFEGSITVEQLVLRIKELLEECPYCHQSSRVGQVIQVDDYYKERLVYIHQECETSTRKLEREHFQKERERQKEELQEKLQIEGTKRKLQAHEQRQQILRQQRQTAFKVILGGMSLYAILLYTLGFNYFILIFIIILSFCIWLIFI